MVCDNSSTPHYAEEKAVEYSMQFEDLINSMSQDTYERLVSAVETGRWPDGAKLSEEQLENSLQLVMAYQARFLDSDQHYTVGKDGRIVTKSKSELKRQFLEQGGADTIARFDLKDDAE